MFARSARYAVRGRARDATFCRDLGLDCQGCHAIAVSGDRSKLEQFTFHLPLVILLLVPGNRPGLHLTCRALDQH